MTGPLQNFYIFVLLQHMSLISYAPPRLALFLAYQSSQAHEVLESLTEAHGSRRTWKVLDSGFGWDEPEQALLESQRGMQPGDQSVHGRQRAGRFRGWCAHVPFQLLLQAGQAG